MKIITNLNQRNKDIWAKSPFVKHSTQTAFKVNTETNLWYCFETQQGGNLTDFIKALSKVESRQLWYPMSSPPPAGDRILVYGRVPDTDFSYNIEIGFRTNAGLILVETENTTKEFYGATHWSPINLPESHPQE